MNTSKFYSYISVIFPFDTFMTAVLAKAAVPVRLWGEVKKTKASGQDFNNQLHSYNSCT